jgi:2-oxoisovalerate dehydrogenase E1 component
MPQLAILLKAYRHMCQAKAMAGVFEEHRQVCRYVHSTSRGHEAIQLATAFHLLPCDFISPYYRDDSILLGLGFSPHDLMLQLLAKADDPFTAGREYYAHPNWRSDDKPVIIHQSSATGMQVIPATGIAQGLNLMQNLNPDRLKRGPDGELPLVVCSMGDASITEGEVSEAFQVAVLKKLPIIYLVQDNDWGISVTAAEARAMDAYDFAAGFSGMKRARVAGYDFSACFELIAGVCHEVRNGHGPYLVHAAVPLLGHHTSGVRREFYRTPDDLDKDATRDPIPLLRHQLLNSGTSEAFLTEMENQVEQEIRSAFDTVLAAPEPDPSLVESFVFVPAAVTEESGDRREQAKDNVMMVDAALYAIRELMEDFPEAILYGQDVGRRLGGVFREAATLGERFGDHRVFNTAIQEAYIIGSTAGMTAAGLKPIVEIQFADYLFPGFNQLVSEISKSCYLSAGRFPVQVLIRIPCGAYGGGGPYHSGSIESTLLTVKGIKVAYPSNAADMKGLMKAAFLDPNPVVMLEHKGLYWSKVPGTEDARRPEPARDYLLPLGKAAITVPANQQKIQEGASCVVVTYGMGVYWAKAAAAAFPGCVEIVDLRTLFPLDEDLVFSLVEKHGKCLVITEEPQLNSFAEALAGRISAACFRSLDAPVAVIGALNLPAVPINIRLEQAMLPNPEKVKERIGKLLRY